MDETQVAVRTRTFSWADPTEIASHLGGRSGLDLLRAMISGELPSPPFMHMLGIERMEADEGKVVVVMPVEEFHYNPLGTVHGGILSTLLDTAAGCAVHSTLPSGVGYTSLDVQTKFLRPVTVSSGALRCEGSVISRGRSMALAEARLTDGRGRLVAHATSTCLLFETGGATSA